MFSLTSIIFVLGYLSRVSTQKERMFCFEGACYIKRDSVQRNWRGAQEECKKFGSTLPIVSDPIQQRSFEAACRNLISSSDLNEGIWIGAKAFSNDSSNWMWLNGSKYNGTDLQGDYQTGYSFVANTSVGVRAFAASPKNTYSYICYYPTPAAQCIHGTEQTAYYFENRYYVKYYEKMFWFGARNNCLTNGGDLASFTQLSLLDGNIDSNGVWVGLRSSRWEWHDAVTDVSSDVTYTWWSPRQPDDAVPSCISTDGSEMFPGWRDWDCTKNLPFICQVNRTTSTTPPTAATCSPTSALTSRGPNTPTNPSSSTTTPTTPSSSTTTPTTPSSSTATPTTPSSFTTTPTTSTTTPTTPSSSTTTPTTPSSSTTTPRTSTTTPTTPSSTTTTPTTSTTTPTTSTTTPTTSRSSTTTPTTSSSSTTTPTTPSSSITIPTTPSSSITTPTVNPSSSTAEEKFSSTYPAENFRRETRSVHIALAVGLGLGIGVPVIILIVAVIIIAIIVWRKRQSSFPGGNSHSTNSLNYSKPETSEMNELENGRTVAYNGSYAQYTTVRPTVNEDARLPSKQGIVYEPLSFN